jgi:4-aminobutyrate aminotransferase-like enzyme
MEGIHLVNS